MASRLLAFCDTNSEPYKRIELRHLVDMLDQIIYGPASHAFFNLKLTATLWERRLSLYAPRTEGGQ